jgi:phage terminase Nu1 subunit (DNA packaging protein)
MKTIIYLLLPLFLFAGCKSTKQITETKTDFSERKDIELVTESESKTNLLENIETNENLNIASKIVENMLFTFWSVPDSLGRQYPVATGEINRQTNSEQTRETNTKAETNLTNEDKQTANLEDKSKTDSKSGTKETIEETRKVPSRAIWAGLILIIGGIAIWKLKH